MIFREFDRYPRIPNPRKFWMGLEPRLQAPVHESVLFELEEGLIEVLQGGLVAA